MWRLPLDGGEAEQVTRLPLDVDALEVAPGGRHLLLAMAVFPGKSPEETKAALEAKGKSKASGMLYDRLFVRHWDTWEDGTRNHLFAYDTAQDAARDLMPAMDADCPSKPFGGSEEYAVSPDGKVGGLLRPRCRARGGLVDQLRPLLRPARRVHRRRGSSPRTPPGTPSPCSPPTGALAYLAMSRPGFEADRYRVVLRDWASGTEGRRPARRRLAAR